MFVRFLRTLEPFKFRQILLGGRFHVPLPKMTPRQMKLIRRRLESIGFRLNGNGKLRATRRDMTILVDSSGLCTSNKDLSDAMAPVVPEIIGCSTKQVSRRVLRESYFSSERRGDEMLIRLSPRLESESYWDELRASGSCALTPDERAVYATLLSSFLSPVTLLTDFPVQGCLVKRIGRRQYYESGVGPSVAASTLRGMRSKNQRNSYLPRDSILRLRSPAPRGELVKGLFEGLGDWCFLFAS